MLGELMSVQHLHCRKRNDKCLGEMVPSRLYILGSVSNDDGDDNENAKNLIGLD